MGILMDGLAEVLGLYLVDSLIHHAINEIHETKLQAEFRHFHALISTHSFLLRIQAFLS